MDIIQIEDEEIPQKPKTPRRPLTPHQTIIANNIVMAILSGEKRIVLKGSAGTGKTFLTDQLITIIKRDAYKYGAVYVTAPTHKALNVLRGKIEERTYVQFRTIHSALSLKRELNPETGKPHFIQKINPSFPPFKGASLVLLDESSMVDSRILEFIKLYPDLVFIFIGDPQQLNPVGEVNSPVFNQDWPTFELTEIVRQGVGNPIIDLSRNLNNIFLKKNNIIDGLGYLYDNNYQYVVDKLAEINGTDDIKYLAYHNNIVDKVNHDVRQKIYGNPAKVEVGEILVFGVPYGDYHTNDEYKVDQVEIVERPFLVPGPKTQYDFIEGTLVFTGGEYDIVEMKSYYVNEEVPILHEDSYTQYNQITKSLKDSAKKRELPWVLYYWFLESLPSMTYNHAITVHKSQGSTYGKAIINLNDIRSHFVRAEKTRLFYTAITRASETVIFNNY